MLRYKNSDKEIKRRMDTYKCDGVCYWATGMCPRVNRCRETAWREWLAGFIVCLMFLATIVLLVLSVVYMLKEY